MCLFWMLIDVSVCKEHALFLQVNLWVCVRVCVSVLFLLFNGLPSFSYSLMIVVTHSTVQLRALTELSASHMHIYTQIFREEKRSIRLIIITIILLYYYLFNQIEIEQARNRQTAGGVKIENYDKYKLNKIKGESN